MPPAQDKNTWGDGGGEEQGPPQGAPPGSPPENDLVNCIKTLNQKYCHLEEKLRKESVVFVDTVSGVVCIVVDRSPDVHHRAGDQVDQELHDPNSNSLQFLASIVLAVNFEGYLDAKDEEEVKNEEKCDGQSFVMNLKDVLCCDKENDKDKYPCNDLRDVTEEERPHVAEVLKEGHSVLEVASHGQA